MFDFQVISTWRVSVETCCTISRFNKPKYLGYWCFWLQNLDILHDFISREWKDSRSRLNACSSWPLTRWPRWRLSRRSSTSCWTTPSAPTSASGMFRKDSGPGTSRRPTPATGRGNLERYSFDYYPLSMIILWMGSDWQSLNVISLTLHQMNHIPGFLVSNKFSVSETSYTMYLGLIIHKMFLTDKK